MISEILNYKIINQKKIKSQVKVSSRKTVKNLVDSTIPFVFMGSCKRKNLPGLKENDDRVSITQLIKSCGKKKDIWTLRSLSADREWITDDLWIANTLIRSFAKCGAMREAQEVFKQMPERNVVSWNALIAGHLDHGFGEQALLCFRQMQNDGVIPSSVTYICCLKACAVVGALEFVEEIHAEVRQHGLLNKDIALGNSLLNAYAKCGAVKVAQGVFDELAERDVVSWNSLIDGYAEQGFGHEALKCFRAMQNNDIVPDLVTYVCSLKACAIVGDIETVEEIAVQVGELGLLKADITLGTALMNAYAKCGAVKKAREVFKQLEGCDVVSWSALIEGYTKVGFGEDALELFMEMERYGVAPNSLTYTSSLKACAIVGSLGIVEKIHMQVKLQGLLNKHIPLGSALINAYSKCGVASEAQNIFDQLVERNVETWTAVLAGYAELGQKTEMLQLLNRMMAESIFPDHVTALVLLNSCSHEALLVEGERLFCMIGEYGIASTPDHYTCMVDLFGRAGQIEKAKCFMLDHIPTITAFLGACQKWVNVDLGRWAYEKLLQLDQKYAGAYVCMSNIYATAGMMNEANEIECLESRGK